MTKATLILILSTCLAWRLSAQQNALVVIRSYDDYKKQVKIAPGKKMVELSSQLPGLVYDLRYATTNNFMHRLMYPAGTTKSLMRADAIEKLKKVQEELKTTGRGLKIFDAYRPYSVTVAFWELVKDERYVANPAKGSGHNRGISVDLTIIDLATGRELEMGTGFDNFSDTAHQTFTSLPAKTLENRRLLRSLMEKNGFVALETEWWHFYLPNSSNYEVLDLPFKKLLR